MAKKKWKDAEYCHHATLPISLDIIGLPFRNFVMRDLDIIFSFYFSSFDAVQWNIGSHLFPCTFELL